MQGETKQILLRQPAYTLELVKRAEGSHKEHAFVMYPCMHGMPDEQGEGVTLLIGKGHDVSRRDMHYAIYLFQRFHLNRDATAAATSA